MKRTQNLLWSQLCYLRPSKFVAHAALSLSGPEQIQQKRSSRSGQRGLPVVRNPEATLISVEAERW